MAHITIQPLGIWPIGLDRNDVESMILNQVTRNGGASAIELAGAMRRLTQKHELGTAEPGKGRAECIGMLGWRQILSHRGQRLDGHPV